MTSEQGPSNKRPRTEESVEDLKNEVNKLKYQIKLTNMNDEELIKEINKKYNIQAEYKYADFALPVNYVFGARAPNTFPKNISISISKNDVIKILMM